MSTDPPNATTRFSDGAPSGPPAGGWARSRRRHLLPWGVLAFWLLVAGLLGPYAGQLTGATEDDATSFLPSSADSTQVAELVEELPGGDTFDLVLVYQREDGLTAEDEQAAEEQVSTVTERFTVAGGERPQPVPSEDGTTLFYAVPLAEPGGEHSGTDESGDEADEADEAAVEEIRDIAGRDAPAGLTVQVGGPGVLSVDTGAVFESIDLTLTLATVGVVTLLLILIYRSPLLWLLPLLCVGVAAAVAMSLVYGLVQAFGLTVSTQNSSIMTVLLFGVGTDYALLLVSRYRDELRTHHDARDAMHVALRGCVPALLASAGTVSAALLCLLLADLNTSSGLGPVGSAAVLSALVVMVTLLPALLVLAGRRVFWPLVPAYGSQPRPGVFARLGSSVSRRPVALLTGGLLVLGSLSLGMLNLPGPLKDQDYFIDTPESVTAMETLASAYPESSTQPITVLADNSQAAEALERVEGTDGVAGAETARSGAGWTEIRVLAADPPESDGERETVQQLRDELSDLPGEGALVGGDTAQKIDQDETNAQDRALVIPLVLLSVLVILVALFRSFVAAALLLAAVVVSWGAALGLGGLVFGPLFGFEGIDGWMVMCSFVFSVSLGVDYGIFLMHRMREELLHGADSRSAVLAALRRTGGVIASAGIVLAATFSVLMSLPLVFMVEIGFVVAVGVLLDTFIVRPYLLTSACWLLGDRVWWPGLPGRPDENGTGSGSGGASTEGGFGGRATGSVP